MANLSDDRLTAAELNTLGLYNAERQRGISHTAEYGDRMAALQERFDATTGGESLYVAWAMAEMGESRRWWQWWKSPRLYR